MAMSVVSSKFALLPDDDEGLNKTSLRKKVFGKSNGTTESVTAAGSISQSPEKSSNAKKKKNKSKKNTKKSEAKANNDEQYAQWLSHDQVANDETFAQELQAAILASKVQYDLESTKPESPVKNTAKISGGGGVKKGTMSLQDFNRLCLESEQPIGSGMNKRKESVNEDSFFVEVEEATKKALNREQIKESLKQRYEHLPDQALVKQYRSVLEAKDEDIIKLTEENQKLTLELDKVKKRYKQFRELLDQVECRQKAEIISENIKLKKVQEEIAQEMNLLREENEKLKTKVSNSKVS